jgi:hypothetical protein
MIKCGGVLVRTTARVRRRGKGLEGSTIRAHTFQYTSMVLAAHFLYKGYHRELTL